MTGALRGIHVLFIIGGFFAVTFAANAVFIVNAVKSFPGEDAPKSYLQGLEYNSTLERRALQKQKGWTAAVGFDEADIPALRLHLTSASGAPVRDALEIQVRYHLAGQRGEDNVRRMVHLGGGNYVAVPGRLPPGRIDMTIEARRKNDGQIVFEAQKSMATPG